MKKTYRIKASFFTDSETIFRESAHTRKRDAVAIASSYWNDAILRAGFAGWKSVPTVSKVIDGKVVGTFAIGVRHPHIEGEW